MLLDALFRRLLKLTLEELRVIEDHLGQAHPSGRLKAGFAIGSE
jgi:hypothetical protein